MTKLIKGTVPQMRQYVMAAASMQDWIAPEARQITVSSMAKLNSRVILATDDRHMLLGSILWFPSVNDDEVKENEGKLPFDLGKAFTVSMVWVDRSQRGKGLGKALFEEAHKDAIAEGYDIRLGYAAATEDIWTFAGKISTTTLIEDLQLKGRPVQYSRIK